MKKYQGVHKDVPLCSNSFEQRVLRIVVLFLQANAKSVGYFLTSCRKDTADACLVRRMMPRRGLRGSYRRRGLRVGSWWPASGRRTVQSVTSTTPCCCISAPVAPVVTSPTYLTTVTSVLRPSRRYAVSSDLLALRPARGGDGFPAGQGNGRDKSIRYCRVDEVFEKFYWRVSATYGFLHVDDRCCYCTEHLFTSKCFSVCWRLLFFVVLSWLQGFFFLF